MKGINIVLVALLVASVSCTPAVPRSVYDDKIKALLESIKQNMGKPQFGLPPLDPLEVNHLDLNIDQEIATLKGSLDSLKVTKLSTFNVESVTLSMFTLSLSFNISLNELDITGEYDVDGNLGGGLLPVYGKGPFSIILGDFWTAGTIKLGYNNTFLYIKNFDLDYNLGHADVNLSGLLGGGDLSDLINQMLTDMVPKLASQYKTKITAYVSDLITGIGNKFLDGKTLEDILEMINGSKTTTAEAAAMAAAMAAASA